MTTRRQPTIVKAAVPAVRDLRADLRAAPDLPVLRDFNAAPAAESKRAAVNFAIQGSAADIVTAWELVVPS